MANTHNTLGGGAMIATPGSSMLMNPDVFSLNWGDYIYASERAQKMHYIQMPQAQWDEGVEGHMAAHPHNRAVRRWIENIAMERSVYATMQTHPRIPVDMPDSDELNFRLWKEMIENPWQYGDDIVEWLKLDDVVCAGPKRWRAAAYWQVKEDEYIAKEWERVLGLLAKAAVQQQEWIARKNAAATCIQTAWRDHVMRVENALATRIQAAWRGYSTRVQQTWRDCAKCLKHGTCVEQVDGLHVCRCCWGEANPVEDDDEELCRIIKESIEEEPWKYGGDSVMVFRD